MEQGAEALNLAFEGLEVEAKILGAVADGWVQIAVAGDDEGIATNYLIKEIGLCPNDLANIRNFSTLKGYIKNIGKNRTELSIDVGVFQPEVVIATVTLRRLQTQLVDERKIALKKIAELFGFCEGLPITIKKLSVNEEEGLIEAELSNRQIGKYKVWRESLLDRLIVLGSSFQEIKMMLKCAKLDRDVIDVETLGLLEHALVCKLGTDAAGLVPKIGRNLENAGFVVFNPKSLREFLEA